jgi:hypothetical protein
VLCTPAGVRYRGEKLAVTIVACVSQSRPFLPLDCHCSCPCWKTPARLVDHAGSGERGLAPSRVLAANANAVRRASCYTAVRAAEDR